MFHAKLWQALFLGTVLSTLIACSGGGGNDNNDGGASMVVPPTPDPDPDPDPQPQTDFTGFVIGLFDTTADDTDPAQINELDISFADQENPAAFDELLE